MSDPNPGRSQPNRFAFPVVGIDATAEDVDALKQFFDAMPVQPGAAFVVVLRAPIEPAHLVVAGIQPATAMPAVPVRQTMRIEPDHIYVIEASLVWTIVENELRTVQSRGEEERRDPIDVFFDSLATAYGERAIGVVLAGVTTDSALGFTRLKEFGGVTFAQSKASTRAEDPSWPPNVTNAIDFQLDATEMPQRMLELWANAKKIRLARVPAGKDQDEGDAAEPSAGMGNIERTLREIMMILRNRTGHDFRHYKRATVLRRIERRLQVNGLSELQQYRDYLQTHPAETATLLQDMLISVTNFFRDKDAYDVLRDRVMPAIFENRRPTEPVRVWVVGCATGEEAYTVAMMLQEASARTRDQVPFQVFATDISERAIATAREGLYPASIAADVDPTHLRQFFTKDGDHYRIKKALRERVLFALHNVLSDPPFSRLDLACCRNLLIYFDREAQIDTLRAFHFALRPNSHLFLGSSETADRADGLFTVVDKKTRVYRASTPGPVTAPGALDARPTFMHLQPAGKRKFSFGELHQRVVEQHAPPSVLVNRGSEILHLSDRAGRFLQYVGGEPSHNILTVVRRELRLELRSAIYQALQNNVSVESRRVPLDRDGRSYFVKMTARPVHDPDANADFVLILFDEVEDSDGEVEVEVDEAILENQRDPIIAQLERELQRTREFLAVVSHELKHPLNLISASTELIGRSAEARTNATISRAADTIRRTVLGQAQIIDDLLDMSRLRTGKLSIACRPIDLKEVVQRISHTMQDEAERKDIDFRLSVPDGPVSIHADLTRIEQVVWNLVSNALKFTDGDGKITVQLSLDDHCAVLSITDNGVGIDGAALPNIFEMFEQSRGSAQAVRGGLGIGLSLVKDLVALHGGEVHAHSDGIGHGATFTVKLPRVVEAVAHDGSGPASTTFLKGEHVLLVDDDHDTVETFRLLLEMEGASVTVATSGDEALEMLSKRPPSLILSDLGMPGMSGLAFIEAVRQRPDMQSVKAIALSGFGRPSDVDEATQAGFDGYLTKPVMLDALLSAIARVRVK